MSIEKVTRTRGTASHVTHTAYEYDDVPASWLLGRVDKETVTEYLPTHRSATSGSCSSATTCAQRVTEWSYHASKWLVTEQVIEPRVAKWKLDTDYTHDRFGNVDLTTVSGGSSSDGTNIVSRSTDPGYDARGQFPITFENEKDHREQFVWDSKFGVATRHTDANGAATNWLYDTVGRVKRETRPDGSVTQIFRAWCTATTCPADGVMKVLIDTGGAPAEAVIYDRFGRETLRARAAWTADTATRAAIAIIDTDYDSLGRVKRRSRPYLHGATAVWHQFTYDVLDRVRTETAPDNGRTTTTYTQLQTTVTNARSQATRYTRDVFGRTVSVRDAASGTTAYVYDAFGNLLRVTDPSNNAIVNTYNIRGFRESMVDPDTGTTNFKYNVLGELIERTDAKDQSITFEYDVLGRLTERDDIEGTGGVTTWTYDTATKGKGRLHTVDGAAGDDHTYSYDTHGRLSQHRTTIDSTNYDVGYTYDSSGRLATLRYPSSSQYTSGLTVRYDYTGEGQLKAVRNTDGNALFWEIDGANAAGQVTGESFGNGVDTARTYDANTGFLTGIESGETTATDRQDEAYTWDALGNLTQRQDQRQRLTETFTYDSLNRLTRSAVGQTAKTYAYDAIGNLTRKSDVSATAYTYGTQATGCTQDPGPSAVSVADSQPFCYDANGNMTKGYNFRSDAARTYTWTTYNKPSRIVEGTATLDFTYGADRSRFKQVNSSGSVTTLYIDGLFEKRTAGTTTTQVHYIYALGRAVAVYTAAGTNESTRYLHDDHQGSIVLVTDEDGDVEGNRYSFDAFGRRRNATTWADTLTALSNADTTRGYTGHESLDSVDLVHMNGRVYDPHLGRMLSADPYVQAPFQPQNLNRYSYVLNNPLSLVDPTGFNFQSGFGMWIWADDRDLDSGCVSCRQARAVADYLGRQFDRELRRSLGGGGSGGGSVSTTTVEPENVAGNTAASQVMGTVSVTSHGWVDARGAADVTADVLIPGYGLARCTLEGNCTYGDWVFGVLDVGVAATGVGYGVRVVVKGGIRTVRGARRATEPVQNVSRGMTCSFVAGTLVATPEGLKPIEDIVAGDWVLARDEVTGKLAPKRVTFAYSSMHEDVLVLTVRQDDGEDELIITTTEHPFYVKGHGWVPAGELGPDDMLEDLNGTALAIRSMELVDREQTAYNFEVADYHTYSVGTLQVWVHNACDYKFKGRDALRRTNKQARDAAKEAGLSRTQRETLHREISGEDLSYHEIFEIAHDIKAGRI